VAGRHEPPPRGARVDMRTARRLPCAAMVVAVGRETIWRERHA
jgi:hypothetical protein